MLIGRKVTVIGAGIGGLAAALSLAQRGAQVKILEQAEAIHEIGAGLQVSPNGVSVLEALGLGDAVRALAVPCEATVLRDFPNGKVVARVKQSGRKHPYLLMHRADLHRVLADAVRAAGVKIHLLQHISAVSPHEDHSEVITAQGARHCSDILVGADGLHSVVRLGVAPSAKPFFTGQVAWRAIVPAQNAVDPVSTVFMGPGRHAVLYPIRGGEYLNIVAIKEQSEWVAERWSQQDDPDNLRAAFADFPATLRAALEPVETVHMWGLHRHPVAPIWSKGTAVLLGDAAHPTLPYLAQGANMALEDAWVLSDCLSQHPNVDDALHVYQLARLERSKRIVAASNANARRFHISSPIAQMITHTGLRVLDRAAPNLLPSRFNWLYDHDVTQSAA